MEQPDNETNQRQANPANQKWMKKAEQNHGLKQRDAAEKHPTNQEIG